ncbi:Branched-chain-amino-acid aminotransferase, mitochondrial [Asimina triloba]
MFLRHLCRHKSITQFTRFGGVSYTSDAAASVKEIAADIYRSDDDNDSLNWDELGFGLEPTDYMYIMKCSQGDRFSEGKLNHYGNIELSPSAGVLNYGQGLFEGLKAYRRENGRIVLFRPAENALRMQKGAERMCMPSPSVEQFLDAVKQTVMANKRWVPPPEKGSLYVRPLLMGSGPVLGLAPAPEYTFLIYASPVGNYFKPLAWDWGFLAVCTGNVFFVGEGLTPLNLFVDDVFHRAIQGGAGGAKTICNYAPVLKAQTQAKSKGFSDVLYLDSANKKNLEEASSCNVFIVKNNVVSTPATQGTILSGITRKSIMDLCPYYGFQVQERPVTIEELIDADEVFCTGTAVVVAPVGSVTYLGKRVEYRCGDGTVSEKLRSALTSIQMGHVEDKMSWMVEID